LALGSGDLAVHLQEVEAVREELDPVRAHVVSGAPALGIVSDAIGLTHGSALAELGYIWRLYLPPLPGMHPDFAGLFTARQIWFDWYIGLYGWLDTTFPGWVYDFALIPAALIAGLCVRGLLTSAGRLRGHVAELVVYGAMCAGLMALIGADSYIAFPALDAEYGQARYLLLPPPPPPLAAAARCRARARRARRRKALEAGRRRAHHPVVPRARRLQPATGDRTLLRVGPW
jgi:hypothetical protein